MDGLPVRGEFNGSCYGYRVSFNSWLHFRAGRPHMSQAVWKVCDHKVRGWLRQIYADFPCHKGGLIMHMRGQLPSYCTYVKLPRISSYRTSEMEVKTVWVWEKKNKFGLWEMKALCSNTSWRVSICCEGNFMPLLHWTIAKAFAIAIVCGVTGMQDDVWDQERNFME